MGFFVWLPLKRCLFELAVSMYYEYKVFLASGKFLTAGHAIRDSEEGLKKKKKKNEVNFHVTDSRQFKLIW